MTNTTYYIPTPEDIDASLRSLSDDDLIAIVQSVDRIPMAEWWRLTAQERRAMRASNMLAGRAAVTERRMADAARDAANATERNLIARRQQAEQRRREENAAFLEKKRTEYHRGW